MLRAKQQAEADSIAQVEANTAIADTAQQKPPSAPLKSNLPAAKPANKPIKTTKPNNLIIQKPTPKAVMKKRTA